MGASITRRSILAGAGAVAGMLALGGFSRAFAGEGAPVRPPGGQDEAHLQALCVKCDRCRSACPRGCVVAASVSDGFLGARTPKLDFHRGFCDFCNRCIESCPTGALAPFDPMAGKLGVARLDASLCLAYTSGACDACKGSCAYEALAFGESGLPSVDEARCNGCGACVDACEVNVYRAFDGSRERALEVAREVG